MSASGHLTDDAAYVPPEHLRSIQQEREAEEKASVTPQEPLEGKQQDNEEVQ